MKIKLFILLIIILTTYIIYVHNSNNYLYLPLGINITNDNKYPDYVKEHLDKTKHITIYSKDYMKKDITINNIYNDILINKELDYKGNKYNIERLLRESNIITISIGLNDIIYQYNINDKRITKYEEIKIVNKIYNNYQDLVKEIKKYNKNKIYVIGNYKTNSKYDSIISLLNKKLKESNEIYIDIENIDNNKDKNHIIAEKIIKKYEKSNKKLAK